MAHFTTAKLELKLHLVTFVQKLLSVPHLDHVIVRIDIHPKLDLFKLGRGRFTILLLFGKVVSVLSKINDLANGWVRGRSHLDQIKPERLSSSQGILQFHDSQLFVGRAENNPHFSCANSTVDADLLLLLNKTISSECG